MNNLHNSENDILDENDIQDDVPENSYQLGLPMLWYMGNQSHWLVFDIISKNEFYDNNYNWLNEYQELFTESYPDLINSISTHKWSSKYIDYMMNGHLTIAILKVYYLDRLTLVCINKTFWLKFFQHQCRKNLKKRRHKKTFHYIKKREYGIC